MCEGKCEGCGSCGSKGRVTFEERLESVIQLHGFMVVGVVPQTKEDVERIGGMGFMYTIGLVEKGHPELLIAGLPSDVAYTVLDDLGERVLGGETFVSGEVNDYVLKNYSVTFRQANNQKARDDYACQAYFRGDRKGQDVSVLQVVWPDREGRYPWEIEWSEEYRQDLL